MVRGGCPEVTLFSSDMTVLVFIGWFSTTSPKTVGVKAVFLLIISTWSVRGALLLGT